MNNFNLYDAYGKFILRLIGPVPRLNEFVYVTSGGEESKSDVPAYKVTEVNYLYDKEGLLLNISVYGDEI